MKMHHCPECKQKLNQNKCVCGWVKKNEFENNEDYGICAYSFNEKRCPLPGTNSRSRREAHIYYCLEHYLNIADEERCKEILCEAERNYENIMEERIDWRKKLFLDDFIISKVRR